MKVWIVPFAVATLTSGCLLSAPAAKPKPATDGGVICTFPEPGDASLCQASTNLTANQVTNQTSVCTSMNGTMVAACPGGAVGCCATTSGSVDFDQCYYGISVAFGEKMCASTSGAWTVTSGTSDAGATD